ncbi:MAG: T9SS type A sorting domain-containing protein, partial [Calditrichia bacterium]
TGYISVPPASYTLDVTPANDNNTVVASFQADLSGLGGGAAVVFASGFLNPMANQNGESFQILAALPDGMVVPFSPLTSLQDDRTQVSSVFSLEQNYPNPFNPATLIRFSLPGKDLVTLKVYNLIGQEVATLLNEPLAAGEYEINFDGMSLASGIYFYELRAGEYQSIRRMTLLK